MTEILGNITMCASTFRRDFVSFEKILEKILLIPVGE